MTIANRESEIESFRSCLQQDIANYRAAINNDLELFYVKSLYQKAKTTMRELKFAMIDYEKLLNEEMEMFDKRKQVYKS